MTGGVLHRLRSAFPWWTARPSRTRRPPKPAAPVPGAATRATWGTVVASELHRPLWSAWRALVAPTGHPGDASARLVADLTTLCAPGPVVSLSTGPLSLRTWINEANGTGCIWRLRTYNSPRSAMVVRYLPSA